MYIARDILVYTEPKFTILIDAPLHIKTVLLCLFDAEE